MVLGSASGFPTINRQSPSVHIRCGDKNILLDCGEGASGYLMKSGLGVSDIDTVFISHMHADHIGGLVQLVQTWQIGQWEGYTPKGYMPMIIAPSEGIPALKALLDAAYLMPEVISPMKVEFSSINSVDGEEVSFTNKGIVITAIPNSHLKKIPSKVGDGFAAKYPGMRCQAFSYALTFKDEERRIVYSGDIGQLDELEPLMQERTDLLVVELAHHNAETLMQYLTKWKGYIGTVLVNHIGPRYDAKGPEVEYIAREAEIPSLYMGYDGLKLMV